MQDSSAAAFIQGRELKVEGTKDEVWEYFSLLLSLIPTCSCWRAFEWALIIQSYTTCKIQTNPCAHLKVQESEKVNWSGNQELVEIRVSQDQIPSNFVMVSWRHAQDSFPLACIKSFCVERSKFLEQWFFHSPTLQPVFNTPVWLQHSMSLSSHLIASVPKLWG
jgi:hypothetical protein